MAIIGIITNAGLEAAQKAATNEGWYLKPVKFSVSELSGTLDPSRTEPYTEWYSGPVSPPTIRSASYIEFPCHIPPDASTSSKNIAEIYLWVEDPENAGQYILFGIGQPDNPIPYYPDSDITLRLSIIIQNVNLTELFEFKYSQAYEISEHNSDLYAHPDIQDALEKAGIYVRPDKDFKYAGQYWDQYAVFDSTVSDGDVVYKGNDGKYYPALADGSEKSNVVGVADLNRGLVIVQGLIQTAYTTYPANAMVYLSDTQPGRLTTEQTIVPIGVCLGNGVILVAGRGGGGGSIGLPYRTKLSLTSKFTVPSDYGCVVPDRFVVDTGGELIVEDGGVFIVVDNEV